jgi:hypothetical protein
MMISEGGVRRAELQTKPVQRKDAKTQRRNQNGEDGELRMADGGLVLNSPLDWGESASVRRSGTASLDACAE